MKEQSDPKIIDNSDSYLTRFRRRLDFFLTITFTRSHEFSLFFECLESTVSKLRRRVDKLENDFLSGCTRNLRQQRFSKSDDSLLDTSDTSLLNKSQHSEQKMYRHDNQKNFLKKNKVMKGI